MSYGFIPCKIEPIVMHKTTSTSFIVLAICEDDIVLIDSHEVGISTTKAYLQMHFMTCDLRTPGYFLGVEFACQSRLQYLKESKPFIFSMRQGYMSVN